MMADTQHFCLRWNNYQSSITSAFENLRDDEDFVDVTLACDGKSLKAHRVVLSACSPYFRELLKSTPCKHPVIVLQDVAFSDLHSLVEFIYHGEVNVHQRNLSSFLKTAEVLRVSGLTQQADDKDDGLPISQQRPLSKPIHLPSFPDKHVEDSLFTSPPSPPPPHTHPPSSGGATVNQLLRRAAAMAANRRERHNSAEHSDSSDQSQHSNGKRPRTEPTNNNDSTSNNQAQDFSTTNSNLKQNSNGKKADESNNHGSPSPTGGHNAATDNMKTEPLDLLIGTNDLDNSNDSVEATGDITRSTVDHDEQDSIQGHINPSNYLSAAQESKLFGTSGGSFNFSMAALAGDPAGLAGLNNQLQANPDGTPGGSSQGGGTPRLGIRWVTTGEGSGRPSKGSLQCPHCDKCLLNRDTLARHVLHMHQEPLYASKCMLCNREYRTRNSLMVHISRYHRLKREPICGQPMTND